MFIACATALAFGGVVASSPARADNTYIVSEATDDGTGTTVGSLSWAIDQANANPGSTILVQVESGNSITETGAVPTLTANTIVNGTLQITGAGATPLVTGGSSTLQVGGFSAGSVTGNNGSTGGSDFGLGYGGGGGTSAVAMVRPPVEPVALGAAFPTGRAATAVQAVPALRVAAASL
jgi:hypothetical protein